MNAVHVRLPRARFSVEAFL